MWPSQQSKQAASGEVDELKAKIKKMKEEHQKDKDFYEEALEARMNQMEELEQ